MVDSPRRAVGTFSVMSLETVDSTNLEATRRLAQHDALVSSNTVIHAREQSGGKARRGRSWFSPAGNLYCSFIVRPEVEIGHAANAGYVAALAVCDFVDSLAPREAGIYIKWPNDVLLNGRKVSGILLEAITGKENGLECLIVGVGINLNEAPASTPYPSTSLRREGIKCPSIEDGLSLLVDCFSIWYEKWCRDGFQAIREPWMERARGVGEQIVVRLENNDLSGLFSDIDPSGALLLRQGNETRVISAGDVFFPDLT